MIETYVLAFLAVLLIVGIVMMWVAWVARAGGRLAMHSPSTRHRRWFAQALVGFGIFGVGYHLGVFVYGGEIRWLSVIVSMVLLAQGLFTLHDLRQDGRSSAAL